MDRMKSEESHKVTSCSSCHPVIFLRVFNEFTLERARARIKKRIL